MGGFISGLMGGYGETMLGIQERQQREEMERRRARLGILQAAIPNIKDSNLRAEAFRLMEEFATGKSARRKGVGGFFGGLIGRKDRDVGQAEKFGEFFSRPRKEGGEGEGEKKPGAPETQPQPSPGEGLPSIFGPPDVPRALPPVPGGMPSAAETPAPAARTVQGPFQTPEEEMRQGGAAFRYEARIKQDVEEENRKRLEAEARRIGLTDPRDIANYVNSRTLPGNMAGIDEVVVPGAALKGKMEIDSLGNPRSDDQQYRVRHDVNGKILTAFPSVSPTHVSGSDVVSDEDSSTKVSRLYRDFRTGQIIGIQRDILPPVGWAPTTTMRQRFVPVMQADGRQVLQLVQESSTRTPQLPGAKPGAQPAALPPAPGLPPVPGVSGSTAGPSNISGSPTTGAAVLGPGVEVGARPVGAEEKRLQENAASGLRAIQRMRTILKQDRSVLVKAAIPGSPFAREFAAVRGEAIDVITRLRTGAALNMQEEDFYKRQFPGLMDLLTDPKAIEAKLTMYEDLFRRFTQRGPASLPPSGSERRPGSKGQGPSIVPIGPSGKKYEKWR